jgi:hypothetical protein
MKREYINVGKDGGMTGFHEKILVVSLRRNGTISLRGAQDSRLDGYGYYSPPGRTRLASVGDLQEACKEVLDEIDAQPEVEFIESTFRRLGAEWESQLMLQYADLLRAEYLSE